MGTTIHNNGRYEPKERSNVMVKCNWCEWLGHEYEIEIIKDKECCPNCHKTGFLMDIKEEQ